MGNEFTACMNCTERKIGCHSTCERYLSEKRNHFEKVSEEKAITYEQCFVDKFLMAKRKRFRK